MAQLYPKDTVLLQVCCLFLQVEVNVLFWGRYTKNMCPCVHSLRASLLMGSNSEPGPEQDHGMPLQSMSPAVSGQNGCYSSSSVIVLG